MDTHKDRKLPQVSKEHIQEWTSIRKFKDIMEDGKFIVREEGKTDYGVDLNLEVVLDEKYASNYRINIQIKDKLQSEKIKNKDLTYSYSLSIKSLCYLLNSPNSIFVLYLEDINLFVWEWVEVIQNDAYKKRIDLYNTMQDKYTYRFCKIIDEDMKRKLYNEIVTRAEQIRVFNKEKKGIREIGNRPYDINISVNSENTKKALKLYLNRILKKDMLDILMLITQYSPKDLIYALKEGIMTSKLADGIMDIENIDIQVLIGTRELSVFEQNQLHEMGK